MSQAGWDNTNVNMMNGPEMQQGHPGGAGPGAAGIRQHSSGVRSQDDAMVGYFFQRPQTDVAQQYSSKRWAVGDDSVIEQVNSALHCCMLQNLGCHVSQCCVYKRCCHTPIYSITVRSDINVELIFVCMYIALVIARVMQELEKLRKKDQSIMCFCWKSQVYFPKLKISSQWLLHVHTYVVVIFILFLISLL